MTTSVPCPLRTLHPSLQAALTVQSLNEQYGQLPLDEVASELHAQCDRISDGDQRLPDALLTTQAFTLDTVFNELTRLAAGREEFAEISALLNLALKTQRQSRDTLKDLRDTGDVFASIVGTRRQFFCIDQDGESNGRAAEHVRVLATCRDGGG